MVSIDDAALENAVAPHARPGGEVEADRAGNRRGVAHAASERSAPDGRNSRAGQGAHRSRADSGTTQPPAKNAGSAETPAAGMAEYSCSLILLFEFAPAYYHLGDVS